MAGQGRASSKALLSAWKDLVCPCLAVHQPYTSFLPFQTPLPLPPTKQSPVSCGSSVGTSRFNYRLPLLTNNPLILRHSLPPIISSSNLLDVGHERDVLKFFLCQNAPCSDIFRFHWYSPSSYRMAEFSGWLSVVSAVQFLHAVDSKVALGGFS